MLLTREEMAFDFGGHKLDPVRERRALAWMMNQFLYGEVTGIQIGQWLYDAPDIDAARFLSRQAVEEFQHVGNFVRIFELLGERPEAPHWVVRYLATGAMPDSWEEHVALEMAIGEGLVLQAFYALIDTIDHPEIVAILSRGVKQEERHVAFGEERTARAIKGNPRLRRILLGQAIVTMTLVSQLEGTMKRTLDMGHPVFAQTPAFVRHSLAVMEKRLLRIGLLDRPVAAISGWQKARLVAEAYGTKAITALVAKRFARVLTPLQTLGFFKKKRLTDTYLDDPAVTGSAADVVDDAPPSRSEAGRRASFTN